MTHSFLAMPATLDKSPSQLILALSFLCFLCLCPPCACPLGAAVAEKEGAASKLDFSHHAVARIEPGTQVGRENANGWNRLVLLAKPRLATGAVDKISQMARSYATQFNVVIMARVSREKSKDGASTRFVLDRVGVGYCMPLGGRNVVISSETYEQLGADLDTIGSIVLGQNEKVLDDTVQIVHSNTVAMFDVQALVADEGKHRDMLVRHMIWVNPKTGKVASLVWPMICDQPTGPCRMASKSLTLLAGGFQEDRIIHVSEEEFTLGIPNARAFALARMPPGRKIATTPDLARLATRRSYTRDTLLALIEEIREVF